MTTRYFLATGCRSSKELSVVALTLPPVHRELDVAAPSNVCVKHGGTLRSNGEYISSCNPHYALISCDIADEVSVKAAKEIASQQAIPLFDIIFSSSDSK